MRKIYIHRGRAVISVTALTLSALALAACGSRPELDARFGPDAADGTDMTGSGGSSPTGGSTVGTGGSTAGTGGTSNAGGTSSGGGGDTGTAGSGGADPICPATCETPLGTPAVFQTRAEANQLLAGRWRICSKMGRAFPPMPADVIGFEVIPSETPGAQPSGWWTDGSLFYLVDSPSGPTRGSGFDYQVSYRLLPFSNPKEWALFQYPNSVFGSAFTFSACPRRWTFASGTAGSASLAPL